jgi:Zn finger protein HypA/HybF involved in hydrogenase expression
MIVTKPHIIKRRSNRSIIYTMPHEEFKTLVKNSESVGQVLRAFRLANKGGNYRTIKRRCENEGIDRSHWSTLLTTKGRKFFVTRLPLAEIFREGSPYTRRQLKERILNENLLDYRCRDCPNTGMWNNKILKLHLEHINGVSNDNRLENLCFLCPNCHSQTETYAGKNCKNVGISFSGRTVGFDPKNGCSNQPIPVIDITKRRKLTIEQVREIRASELKRVDLARKYNVSVSMIYNIITHKNWHDEFYTQPNKHASERIKALSSKGKDGGPSSRKSGFKSP